MNNKTNFNFITSFLTFFLVIFLVGIVSACSSYGTTFHRPAIVEGPLLNKKFQDSNGNNYFILGNKVYKEEENKLTRISIVFDEKEDLQIWDSFICDDYLYFYVTPFNKHVEGIDKIVIMDKNLHIIDFIYTNDWFRNIFVANNYLYYSYEYIVKDNNDNNHFFGLAKYDLSTFEKEVLLNKMDINTCYTDGLVNLFFQSNQVYYDLMDVDSGFFYTRLDVSSWFKCYAEGYGNILFKKEDNVITITFLNNDYSFVLPYEKALIYPHVRLQNGHLLFAVSEFLNSEHCVPHWANRCICHYGKSSLIKFDFSNGVFTSIFDYQSGTVLADFDENGANYYYNGGLFNHGNLVSECPLIEPNGEVTIYGDGYSRHGGEYWYIDFNDDRPKVFLL